MNLNHTFERNPAGSSARALGKLTLLAVVFCSALSLTFGVEPKAHDQKGGPLQQQSRRDSFETIYYKNSCALHGRRKRRDNQRGEGRR